MRSLFGVAAPLSSQEVHFVAQQLETVFINLAILVCYCRSNPKIDSPLVLCTVLQTPYIRTRGIGEF
jgi:late competence protein required for DNA uptake (superfamily II DNA/RNA helicase)